MKKLFLTVLCLFALPAYAGGEYLYKSTNKLDFVKIDKAKKQEREGGLKHPYTIDEGQLRGILGSLSFSKKMLIAKDLKEKQLFADRHVEFLAPYIVDGLKKANDGQVVEVSYFTKDSKYLIQNNRLSIFRVFAKDDGLHFKFNKVYAKILGNHEPKGVYSAATEARGVNLVLEMQPGQSWVTVDPPEVLFDPNFDFVKGVSKVAVVEEVKDKKGKKGKVTESKVVAKTKTDARGPDETPEVVRDEQKDATKNHAGVKQRLKELEELKKEDLVTEKEYQKKRKDLLEQL